MTESNGATWDGTPRRADDHEMHEIARMAAHDAVREQWRVVGVDPDDTEDLREFRRDLLFQRQLREQAETVGGYTVKATVSGLVGAALLAVWYGVKAKLGGQ